MMKKIFCICVAVMMLVFGGTAYATTLDTEAVTELRIAKTDCAYAMQPMGELTEAVSKGHSIYVITKEGI
ncbi:MAG: hypothetical protein VB081_03195, partial [Christensenella sp.]|uniref:hypothetical protein n=1 Tax=Christensenella sp. TaxID=1935934 RepID=UPI002B20B4D2